MLKQKSPEKTQDKNLDAKYTAFKNEKFELDLMEDTWGRETEISLVKSFYRPHQCGLNYCSTNTKSRVVFDASAKMSTVTSFSFNENLMVGPKRQKQSCSKFSTSPVLCCSVLCRFCKDVSRSNVRLRRNGILAHLRTT